MGVNVILIYKITNLLILEPFFTAIRSSLTSDPNQKSYLLACQNHPTFINPFQRISHILFLSRLHRSNFMLLGLILSQEFV